MKVGSSSYAWSLYKGPRDWLKEASGLTFSIHRIFSLRSKCFFPFFYLCLAQRHMLMCVCLGI